MSDISQMRGKSALLAALTIHQLVDTMMDHLCEEITARHPQRALILEDIVSPAEFDQVKGADNYDLSIGEIIGELCKRTKDKKLTEALASSKPTKLRRVYMDIEGGVVHDVRLPRGVAVVVRDHDIDGVDEDRLSGPPGEQYVETRHGE